MARPKKDPIIKQTEFITIASKLFFTKGYEKTSVQDILKEVGNGTALSPSVFYYYFSSKDDLFDAVIKHYLNNYLNDIIEVMTSTEYDYVQKLQLIMNAAFSATDDFTHIDSYFDQDSSDAQIINMHIDKCIHSSLKQPLSDLLKEALQAGFIPNTPLLEAAGFDMLVQILLWAIYPLSHQEREKDGKHHNEKYLPLMPLLFSQILGISPDKLLIKAVSQETYHMHKEEKR